MMYAYQMKAQTKQQKSEYYSCDSFLQTVRNNSFPERPGKTLEPYKQKHKEAKWVNEVAVSDKER